jgi:hypothetical protein
MYQLFRELALFTIRAKSISSIPEFLEALEGLEDLSGIMFKLATFPPRNRL